MTLLVLFCGKELLYGVGRPKAVCNNRIRSYNYLNQLQQLPPLSGQFLPVQNTKHTKPDLLSALLPKCNWIMETKVIFSYFLNDILKESPNHIRLVNQLP